MAKQKPKTEQESDAKEQTLGRCLLNRTERGGFICFGKLQEFINSHNGQYLRTEDSSLHLVLNGRRIPLKYDRDAPELARLLLEACGITDLSGTAQAGIRRLQVEASQKAGPIRWRKFSALSDDGERLYLPIQGTQLLQVDSRGIRSVANGDNEDHFWVEHPYDSALKYADCDPAPGLRSFEKLIVITQACRSPAMRWFVAMAAGLFPFIRDSCPARMLLVAIGPSQSGKTSGAQRFTLLHGLGQVKGDFTVAALSSLGDIGLLAMDNKEQANFTQSLIDFALFLATGAERGRSQINGRLRTTGTGRPVGIITTIEGLVKKELRARSVEIQYGVTGERLPRAPIERAIHERRHEIESALMKVLQRYLQQRSESAQALPDPIPEFGEHFAALCGLVRAFGDLSGKPKEWSENLIQEWDRVLTHVENEEEEEDLEHPIHRLLGEHDREVDQFVDEPFDYQGKAGRLYVTTASDLLTMLQKLRLPNLPLPVNAQGLSRRLADSKFRAFTFLKTDTDGMRQLKRKAGNKPIGFFLPDDDNDPYDGGSARPRHSVPL